MQLIMHWLFTSIKTALPTIAGGKFLVKDVVLRPPRLDDKIKKVK
jgi:hypothetical protein